MISDSVISNQIVRLAACFSSTPACVDDHKLAYREVVKNDDHAARTTAWLIRHSGFFPTPKEIYDAAGLTMRMDDMPRPDKTCAACDGTGYEPVWQLVTYRQTSGGGAYKDIDLITDPAKAVELRGKVDGRTQRIYDCCRPCTRCGYGRSIARPGENADELPGKAKPPQKPGPFLIPGANRQDAS